MAFVFDEQTGKVVSTLPQAGMVPPAQEREPSGLLSRTVGDAATALAKGVFVGIPQAAVGLANVATLGALEKPLGAAGDALTDMGERIDRKYSTQHQEQAQEVANTKGFFPTMAAMLKNPGYLVDTAIEQLPTMVGGAKLGQAVGKSGMLGKGVQAGLAEGAGAEAATAAATKAAAVGEGLVTAGQNTEQIRQEAGGETSFGQRMLGAGSGFFTGALAYGAGKLATKMGIDTPEVMLAGGRSAEAASGIINAAEGATFKQAPGMLSRIGRGALAEGVLEELPQSAQEQVMQNIALGRPAGEGVAEAAAQGLVLGSALGGTFAAHQHNSKVADGVAAIQFLSQPPQLNEKGELADKKMYDEALRALTALHPPASVSREQMNDWRISQMENLANGKEIDWGKFSAISTNDQLVNLAANYVAGVEGKQAAAEQGRARRTAVANGQLPATAMDDQGNEIAQPAPVSAPTRQELAKAEQIKKAQAAGDTETLARQLGQIVRPTPAASATPAAAAAPISAPAPTPAAVPASQATPNISAYTEANLNASIAQQQAKGLASNPLLDSLLAERAGRDDGSRPVPKDELAEKVAAHQRQTLFSDKAAKANGVSMNDLAKNVLDAYRSNDTQKMSDWAKVIADGYGKLLGNDSKSATAARAKVEKLVDHLNSIIPAEEPRITLPKAQNVEAQNVSQGAEPQVTANQADAANAGVAQEAAAAGNAAGQPAQGKEVTQPATGETNGQSTVPTEGQSAPVPAQSSSGQNPAGQGQGTPANQGGNAAAVPEEKVTPPAGAAKAASKKPGTKSAAVDKEAAKQASNAKRTEKRRQDKVKEDLANRADTVVQGVSTMTLEGKEAGGVAEREEQLSAMFRDAQSLLNNSQLPAEKREALQNAADQIKVMANEHKAAAAKVTGEVKAAAKELERATTALEAHVKANPLRGQDKLRYLQDMVSLARATLEQANKKASEGEKPMTKVEGVSRRTRIVNGEVFAFEAYEYDPKAPHAVGTNFLWTNSAMDALASAYPEHPPKSKAKLAEMENAREALDWLMKDNYGLETLKLIAERNAQIERTHAKQAGMRAGIEKGLKQIKDQLRYEYVLSKLGKEVSPGEAAKVQLSKQEETKLTKDYVNYVDNLTTASGGDIYEAVTSVSGTTTPSIQLILQNGVKNANDLLDAIIKLSTKDTFHELAKMLRALDMSGVSVAYEDRLAKGTNANGSEGWKRGSYNAGTNGVTIFSGGENLQVILHELTHAATVQQIKGASAIASATSQAQLKQKQGYNQMVELFNFLKAMPEFAGEYAFKNVSEFVAEVHTNPQLQAKLKATRVPTGLFGKLGAKLGNLLQAYVDAVRNLLGLPPGATDALTKALELTTGYFKPNTKAAPQKSTGELAAVSTPAAAGVVPFSNAQKYMKQFDAPMKGLWSSLAKKGRNLWLQLNSLDSIYHSVKHDTGIAKLATQLKGWFDVDSSKTEVKTLIKDEIYDGFLRDVEIALGKTKDSVKARNMMGWLAGEASNFNVDLGMNFDQNNAKRRSDATAKSLATGKHVTPKLLDAKFKDHIDQLNREYVRFKQTDPALADFLLKGEKVMRKMHTMQMATTVVSILEDQANSARPTASVAQDILDKFKSKLDILQDTKGLTNGDPKLHIDGLASGLHVALTDLFKHVNGVYTGDIKEAMRDLQNSYERGFDLPYMHLGRHGMFKVEFNVKDTSPQTVARLQKLLAPYNVGIGPFQGDSRRVFMRVESEAKMMELRDLLTKESGLIDVRKDQNGNVTGPSSLTAGPIAGESELQSAYGIDKIMRGIKSHMEDKFAELATTAGAQGKAELKAAFDSASMAMKEVMLDMLEVNSARQAGRLRHNVPGYSTDYLQNFAKRSQWYDSAISNMYTSNAFGKVFRDLQKNINELGFTDSKQAVRGQEIHDELAVRFSNSLKPTESKFVTALGVFGNNFYLALSPAYVVSNLTQPYMLTLPLLGGRHGFIASAKAMAKASKDAFSILKASGIQAKQEGGFRGLLDARLQLEGLGLPQDEVEFLRRLIRTGVVDATQGHEMGRMAEGTSSTTANVAKALSLFNHYSEVQNRLSAGLAAYRLARDGKQGMADPAKRLEYAKEVIGKTQFNYSDHNTARMIGRHGFLGAATPLVMQFQKFAFFTIENYIRLVREGFINKDVPAAEREAARKGFYGTLAATAVFAGTMGLPFVSILAAALNGAGDDDKDVREHYREWLASVFGPELGAMVARGALPRALGIDMSGSVGHQDLIPGSRFLADRRKFEDKMKDQSKTMMGPALNAGFDLYAGLNHIANGDIFEGIKSMMPRALKGPAGAVQTAQAGGFVNKQGDPVPIPATWGDMAAQAAGFTPNQKAEQAEKNFYYQSQLTQSKQDVSKLRKELIKAAESGDFTPELQQKWMEYNATHPDAPLKDINSALQARARARAFAEMTGSGLLDGNQKHLPLLSTYAGAYDLEN